MDTAAEMYLERGIDGASLREIADELGIRAASLYHHFDSKNDLLEAIFARGIDVMVTAFLTAEAQTLHSPPRDRLAAHVRAHLAALFENGPYTAAHVTAFRTAPPQVREVVIPMRDTYEAMWSGLLGELAAGAEAPMAASHGAAAGADGSATGSAGPPDRRSLGLRRLLLLGAMNASVEWFDPDRGTLDGLADAITAQVWDGFEQNGQRA